MKLYEIALIQNDRTLDNQDKETLLGTYAGVRFSPTTAADITRYLTVNQIPNALEEGKLHTTLLYSNKNLPNYVPENPYDPGLIGTPTNLSIWPSQPDDETGKVKNCLVQEFDCPELCQRHTNLTDEHGSDWSHDEYKPHVTLSYDVGDNFDVDSLSPMENELDIIGEYKTDLDEDFNK